MSIDKRIFERASTDQEFRRRLLANPTTVLAENGVELSADSTVEIIDMGPNEIHLNLGRNGAAPGFHEILDRAENDAAFRSELLANPKAALEKSFGDAIPADVTVRVHERPRAGVVRLFLPPFQAKTDGELSDAEMEAVAGGGFFKNVMGDIREWACRDSHAANIDNVNNSYTIMHDTSNRAPTKESGSLVVW